MDVAQRAERLHSHVTKLRDAMDQLRESVKLRELLKLVLRLGNFLNGASNRGAALGFRLADLDKLRQVRSADQSTTLLQYIARLPPVRSATWVKDLKERQVCHCRFSHGDLLQYGASRRALIGPRM